MPPWGSPTAPQGRRPGGDEPAAPRSQAGWNISSHTSWNASQAKPLQGRPHECHLLSQHQRRSGLEALEVFASSAVARNLRHSPRSKLTDLLPVAAGLSVSQQQC